jgi:hypothetical protein
MVSLYTGLLSSLPQKQVTACSIARVLCPPLWPSVLWHQHAIAAHLTLPSAWPLILKFNPWDTLNPWDTVNPWD